MAGAMVQYGNIHLFIKYQSSHFVLIQRYTRSPSQLDSFLDIPSQLNSKLHELFPIVYLSDEFSFIPVDCLRHKCVLVLFKDKFCISECRIDFEHD